MQRICQICNVVLFAEEACIYIYLRKYACRFYLAFLLILTEPTHPPGDLKILSVRETEADLSWTGISCPHQHGEIRHYLIRYDHAFSSGIMAEEELRTKGNHLGITIQQLRPNMEYTVMVAGVNRIGIGPFTWPIVLVTPGGRKKREVFLNTGSESCSFVKLAQAGCVLIHPSQPYTVL